jgi:hypothetical protein
MSRNIFALFVIRSAYSSDVRLVNLNLCFELVPQLVLVERGFPLSVPDERLEGLINPLPQVLVCRLRIQMKIMITHVLRIITRCVSDQYDSGPPGSGSVIICTDLNSPINKPPKIGKTLISTVL